MRSISPAPRAPCFPEVKRLLTRALILLHRNMREGVIAEEHVNKMYQIRG